MFSTLAQESEFFPKDLLSISDTTMKTMALWHVK